MIDDNYAVKILLQNILNLIVALLVTFNFQMNAYIIRNYIKQSLLKQKIYLFVPS